MPNVLGRQGNNVVVYDERTGKSHTYQNVPANVTDEMVLQRYAGKASQAPAQAPSQSPQMPAGLRPYVGSDVERAVKSPEIQQKIIANPKAAKPYLEAAEKMRGLRELPPETDIPEPARQFLVDVEKSIMMNRMAGKLKKTRNIDTGPISGAMESFDPLSIVGLKGFTINNLLDRKDPAVLYKATLELLNPYRKLITGAQAAEIEISKFIVPAIPSFHDNDERFNAKSRLHHIIQSYNRDLYVKSLEAKGYDMNEFKKMQDVPIMGIDGRAMKSEDELAVKWALENLSTDPRAGNVLQANGIDPVDVMPLDQALAASPKSAPPGMQETVTELQKIVKEKPEGEAASWDAVYNEGVKRIKED